MINTNNQGWSWLEIKITEIMKIAEIIYTLFQMVIIYLFWPYPATFGKQLQSKIAEIS